MGADPLNVAVLLRKVSDIRWNADGRKFALALIDGTIEIVDKADLSKLFCPYRKIRSSAWIGVPPIPT